MSFDITDAEKPDFHDEGSTILYEGDSKASIKYEQKSGEYVLLWYQNMFVVHDSYSMSAPLRERVLDDFDHIDTFYVYASEEHKLHKFDISALEEAWCMPPSHEHANGDVDQYHVSRDEILNSWDW